MSTSYIQVALYFEDCKGGALKVFIADSTTEAVTYDPTSGLPVYAGGVPIDSDGYAAPFVVDVDHTYDMYAYDHLGALVLTRSNVTVLGGQSGQAGPQGPAGPKGDKGDSVTGPAGANGADGANGIDGTDGEAGVSLVSIRVDESSATGRVLYVLSNNPALEIDAGSVVPAGIGSVRCNAEDALGYLENKVVGTTNRVSVGYSMGALHVDIDQTFVDQQTENTEAIADHETRIDALEIERREKQVLFGGVVGDTTVVIPHTLATSNLCVTCYNAIDNSVIFLGVTVTDTSVSIQGLTPLTSTNQIKVVLIK